jgi:LysR family transcriptional regulator, low CO2-responsive transcriptional regulator
VGSSERLWALFDAHEADLVIGGRPPGRIGDALTRAMRPNLLVVVATPGLAADFDISRTRWLQREAGSGTRATGESLLSGLDADPPRLTLGSGGAVAACAAAGLGATLVSRDAVKRQLKNGELTEVPVPGTPLRRPWHAVTHARPPGATGLLVRHLLDREGWRAPKPTARTRPVRDN